MALLLKYPIRVMATVQMLWNDSGEFIHPSFLHGARLLTAIAFRNPDMSTSVAIHWIVSRLAIWRR